MITNTIKKHQLQTITKYTQTINDQRFVYALIKEGHQIKNKILIRKEFLS